MTTTMIPTDITIIVLEEHVYIYLSPFLLLVIVIVTYNNCYYYKSNAITNTAET